MKPNESLDTKTDTRTQPNPAIRNINKDIPSQNSTRLGDLNPGPPHNECIWAVRRIKDRFRSE